MQDVADELVAWLFARVELPVQPPVDLSQLAEKMAINDILDAAMAEDGRLELRDRRAVIYVRADLSRERRRFTIAHELAHRLLMHRTAPAVAYRRRLTGDNLERLCDDIAAAILLPRQWVEKEFIRAPQGLDTVRRMGTAAGASLSASLVRLREVHRWSHSLLRFNHVTDRWRLAAPAGVPPDLHRSLRTTPETNTTLAAIGRRSREDVVAALPLRLGLRSWVFPAELSVRVTIAIALVDLTRPRPPEEESDLLTGSLLVAGVKCNCATFGLQT